ncbi:hypothetical protein LT85_3395 [Collimonas arenae]|uniref:Glycoside hydrolase family 42 N-terminal domain-containing protein n=1 Tax=Collimonas arenae TaxID=279058 RepID=A0A0A1FCR6_9BURK|nr:hypothetical protein [Collimonas arenae]AIY42553.1 hypothetical protein LT85_3395 [Collimonas arenae]
MNKFTVFYLLCLSVVANAGAEVRSISGPKNFLYSSSDDLSKIQPQLSRPDIGGIQIVYNWKDLEPAKGQYDFAQIEKDLAFVNNLQKKLFIQIQDRFFLPDAKNVPSYLMQDSVYNGGITRQDDNPGENKPVGSGWVAQQWNPAVQARYQALLQALAKKFDGKVYGVNLPETAIDIDMKRDKTGFSCDKYFDAEMKNIAVARQAFKKSHVVQYVNFWPCEWNNDRNYMGRIFEYAAKHDIGLGGPDIVPNKKAQMKNAYPFFHRYKDKISLIAMAVQEPTLTYINTETKKPFTREEFEAFGRNYLGARIIFWSLSAPWLKQPVDSDSEAIANGS